jgi:1-acyl-sn-glycerol-3-phosphate acyltransferase
MTESPPSSLAPAGRLIVEQVLAFLSEELETSREPLRKDLERLLEGAGKERIAGLVDRLRTTGEEFTYYPRNALARDINGIVATYTLDERSGIAGTEHLARATKQPVVFLPNHLSYSDANLFDVLLARSGLDELSARLTVVAGPKVYSEAMRRFSSLCFGTIKTPQSSARSSDEAVMSMKEVARLARDALRAAEERQSRGDAILVFAEGTRSRAQAMQRTLTAITRYCEEPSVLVYPLGISGTERLVPVGEERAHRTTARITVGKPALSGDLSAACDGNRRRMMDVVGVAIARLLPPEYRGVYAESEAEMEDARRIATSLFGD